MSTRTPFQSVLDTKRTPSGFAIAVPETAGIEGDRTALSLKADDSDLELSLAHSIPSPASRLPFEVLESIFLACLPGAGAWICSPLHPVIAISRVCSRWRTIALHCPKLWARPRVSLPAPEFGDGYTPQWHWKIGKLGKAFQVWIDRSGTVPLTMLVESHPATPSTTMTTEAKEAFLTLIKAIKQTSTRWSEFRLSITVSPVCEVLLELMRFAPSFLPLLEKVSLRVSSRKLDLNLCHKLQGLLSTSAIFSTPSLRSLTLRGGWGAGTSSAMNWPPLTHIDMDCTYPEQGVRHTSVFEYFRHLSSIPTLEELSTAIRGQNPNTNPDPTPLELPNLKRLILMGARIPKGFGPYLSLPALHELHIRSRSSIQHDIESGLVEFVVHFGTQLKTLTLFSDSINRQALIKILENVPRLESLALDARTPLVYRTRFPVRSAQEPGVDCYAITELNIVGSSVVGVDKGVADEGKLLRCPQLSKLELGISRDQYKDDAVEQELVELIGSRRGTSRVGVGENMLQALSISYQRVRGFGAKGVLGTLEERGIDLDGFTLRVSTYK